MKLFFTMIGICSIVTITAFAGETMSCKSSKFTYQIKITDKLITTQKMEPQLETLRQWNQDYPGIYSYYAVDSKGPSAGNLRTLDAIRFDISGGRNLQSIPRNAPFEMKIAFLWLDVDVDYYGEYSDDVYSCLKK